MQEYSYELQYGNGDDVLTWTTPSGFNALYEKYKMMDLKARATLNGKQIKHVLKTPTERPDFQGFMCGISPNYIHSIGRKSFGTRDSWMGRIIWSCS